MFLNMMLGDDDEMKKGIIARYWADDGRYTEEVNKLVERRCQASRLTLNTPDNE